MRRSLLSVSTALAAFAVAGTAYACSCIQSTPAELYTRAEVVFSGTVEAVAQPFGPQMITYSFKVDHTWKGSVGTTTSIRSHESTATCGMPMEKGKRYVVLAFQGENGLETNLCSGTAEYEQSEGMLTYLRSTEENSCEPIQCTDGREFPSCNEDGEQLFYTGGTPCFDETGGNQCRPYICPDGTQHPSCTADGHVINYFADPCLTHQAEAPFSDVRSGHSQYDAIVYVKGQGIIRGYPDGTFRASATINRAEFVKMLVEFMYSDTEIGSCSSKDIRMPWDISWNEWYAPYVCVAVDHGIIEGYPDGSFRPAATINVAESAKIFVKTLGLSTSQSMDGEWYAPYMDSLEAKGAVSSTLSPSHLLTRGEMAEILWKLRGQ